VGLIGFLYLLDTFAHRSSPYLGLITFVVLLTFLLL